MQSKPRIPNAPPLIEPLTSEVDRPIWSVMIPVYNCSRYFSETIQSVLLQGYDEFEMQIEVVDDASTDADVDAIVYAIGKGRVKYYRQPQNVGSLRNFETCLTRARGRFIHLLHGDDRIRPGYYMKMEELFQKNPLAGASFSCFANIDGNGKVLSSHQIQSHVDGILKNWLPRIAERNHIQYAAISVRREVYETLGSFYGSTGGEDWEMWVRIAHRYPVAYTPICLAEYREHEDSITGAKFLNGETLRDSKRVMEIVQSYLPESQRRAVLKRSKQQYAWYGVHIAISAWRRTSSRQVAHAIIKQVLQMHKKDLAIYWPISKLYLKMLLRKK